PVLDDQELEVTKLLRENALYRSREVALAVVNRHEDAHDRRSRRAQTLPAAAPSSPPPREGETTDRPLLNGGTSRSIAARTSLRPSRRPTLGVVERDRYLRERRPARP